MPKISSSWKRRERQVAAAFGGKRNVERGMDFGKSAPDVVGVDEAIIEVKERAKLPTLVTEALEQAMSYQQKKVKPVIAVLCQKRKPIGKSVACMYLEDFLEIWERANAADSGDR